MPGDRALVCGWGIHCVAAVHFIAALVVGTLIIIAWNTGDIYEALPWMLVTLVLMAMAVGLWRRRRWTRPFAVVIHGVITVLTFVAFPVCATFLLLVPAKDIAVLHAFALVGLFASMIVGPLSALIVWYMRKRVFAGSAFDRGSS